MKVFPIAGFFCTILIGASSPVGNSAAPASSASIFGFRDAAAETAIEARFLAVPDPKLAEEHLRILTQAPHMAGTPEDKATADYVAQKFRDAGLDTEIVEYRVWMNYPLEISVDVTAPAGVTMHGPTREHVQGDPYDSDPRIVMPFNSMSPSGDVEAEVVYANYGRPEDFDKLAQVENRRARQDRDDALRPKFSRSERICRAGTWRGRSAILYSDPYDDGWRRGDQISLQDRGGRKLACSAAQ